MKDPYEIYDEETMSFGEDDYRVFVLKPDKTELNRGDRGDRPTESRLKTALFVETYMSFCKLQALDIRKSFPDFYSERTVKSADNRSSQARIDDARRFLKNSTGMHTLNTCIEEGRKRAKDWFNEDAGTLKRYMQTTQLEFARIGFPEADDVKIATHEKQKLERIVYALNRASELRAMNKDARKPRFNNSEPQFMMLNDDQGKFPFRDFLDTFTIAHHAAIDPSKLLWPVLRRYSRFFEFTMLTSLVARKQDICADWADSVIQKMMPIFDGTERLTNPYEIFLYDQMNRCRPARTRFKIKYGTNFSGPHGSQLI